MNSSPLLETNGAYGPYFIFRYFHLNLLRFCPSHDGTVCKKCVLDSFVLFFNSGTVGSKKVFLLLQHKKYNSFIADSCAFAI